MKRLIIDSHASQQMDVALKTGEVVSLDLRYYPTENSWCIGVKYNDFDMKGVRVTCGLNILHQYDRKIPFGIMVYSDNNVDPYFIDDFETERVRMFILEGNDLEQIKEL